MPIIFTPIQPAWDLEFHEPGGMVGRHLRKEARQVERLAKLFVGTKTGTLKRSIKAGQPHRHVLGVIIEVKADAPHALLHHEGTKKAYRISPKTKKALSFEVPKKRVIKVGGKRKLGPKQVTVSHVMHPPIPANKYMTRALRVAMRNARGTP